MKTILTTTLIWSALLALTGCTTTAQQAITGYEAAALKSVQAADDNAIVVWSTAACGTPYSALIRNPHVIPAVKVLCLPAGADSSPVTLLDAVPAK